METIHLTNENKKIDALSVISDLPENGRYEIIIKETAKDRTPPQNRSLHLYLRMMTKKFNDAGISQAMAFKQFKTGFELPVTEYFLKHVFQTIAEGMVGKKHTSELTTVEMQEVYEVYNLGMGEKFGISLPWPVKKDKQE